MYVSPQNSPDLHARETGVGGIAADAAGYCYVAAERQIDDVDHVIYTKHDPDGNVVWTKSAPQSLWLYHLRADALGNCYLSGSIYATVAFDGITLPLLDSAMDIVVVKLNTSSAPQLSTEPQANSLRLSWSALATDFQLESTPELLPDSLWTIVPGAPILLGVSNVVTLPVTDATRFYRLRRP